MLPFDEAVSPDGSARPHYVEVLDALAALGPAAAARDAGARARALGLAVGARTLAFDPVPRVMTATEWRSLSGGLARRAAVLDELVARAYADDGGPGGIDPGVLATSPYFEPDLLGAPAPDVSVGLVGFDVVRDAAGDLRVLEDNLLTPGHVALPAAREIGPLAERVASPPVPVHEPVREALAAMLGPDGAILGDHPVRWELAWLGRFLGAAVVTPAELCSDARGIRMRGSGRPIPTLWQRTAEDRLRTDDGRLTHLGELLLEPLRAGTVRMVTRIGAGVAHDKRALPAVAAALGDGGIGTVPTLVLSRPEDRAALLADLPGHVVKPATGAGGRGVALGSALDPVELAARLDAEPHAWVAQPRLTLSVHPTVAGDRLEPRTVDLRVFAVQGPGGWRVLPGGVSRYPTDPRSVVVNTSAGGGIKDVWVLPERAAAREAAAQG